MNPARPIILAPPALLALAALAVFTAAYAADIPALGALAFLGLLAGGVWLAFASVRVYRSRTAPRSGVPGWAVALIIGAFLLMVLATAVVVQVIVAMTL